MERSVIKRPTRNWLDLPSDLMLNILQRVSVADRLQNAEKGLCEKAVDRSKGQLLDLTLIKFHSFKFLRRVADRFGLLKRLELVCYYDSNILSEVLMRLPYLEELRLVIAYISQEVIVAVGRYYSLLKTLKLNQTATDFEIGFAIGKNLHELTHLELIGNDINNIECRPFWMAVLTLNHLTCKNRLWSWRVYTMVDTNDHSAFIDDGYLDSLVCGKV
ncbi:putative F-box/LRR-repeat protein 23 [Bidens hawaiensis]|uniref:putative F-box/LRR-repeat protein 23 n=1 Tax=Bidens hawaiensis TaxID=980011 RepID=UPI004049AE89